jgi:hypothetical protein
MGLVALNYAHYWTRIFPRLQPRGLEKMEEALQQIHSDHAVVFYANALDVPVGDYPFTSLEKARIVTYRLTNDRMWGWQGKQSRRTVRPILPGTGRVPVPRR